MVLHGLVVRAAGTVFNGLIGVGGYKVLRKAVGAVPVRRIAVIATEWGLRGTRRAELAAESARLGIADVVAEAREQIGEEARAPVGAKADGEVCV